MRFLINILKRIHFKRTPKSKIIVFDKNYNRFLKNLIYKDFIIFNLKSSELYIYLLFSSALNYLFLKTKNVSLYEIYIKKYLQKIKPEVIISFEDTDTRILKLAQFFKNVRFIIIQNSYRPPGFYGKITLKETDLLITYSPLVKFNLSSNEIPMKSFKYFGGNEISDFLKNKVILISQYRQYSNDESIKQEKQYYSEIDNGLLFEDNPNFLYYQEEFLNFLSNYFNKNEKQIFYKSASREQTTFVKNNETSYFKKYNISEIEVSCDDIYASDSNEIYICFDSTMIFELISFNKKILIYPHRKLFVNTSYGPHIKVFVEKYPELVINKNFIDFEKKFDSLNKISQIEYDSKYQIFNSMKEFSLNKYI